MDLGQVHPVISDHRQDTSQRSAAVRCGKDDPHAVVIVLNIQGVGKDHHFMFSETIINDPAFVDIQIVIGQYPVKGIAHTFSDLICDPCPVAAASLLQEADDLIVIACHQDIIPRAQIESIQFFPKHCVGSFRQRFLLKRIGKAVPQLKRAPVLVFPAYLHVPSQKGPVLHQYPLIDAFRSLFYDRRFSIRFENGILRPGFDLCHLVSQEHPLLKQRPHAAVDLIDPTADLFQGCFPFFHIHSALLRKNSAITKKQVPRSGHLPKSCMIILYSALNVQFFRYQKRPPLPKNCS